jgi:dTDP-4-dehydrorhamnose 3,5-epimerase
MDGVDLTPLKQIYNSKGNIFHAMKQCETTFNGFGEAYFSFINQGHIKGWKKHTQMTLNLIVPLGEIQFVIFDEYLQKFFNIKLSKNNYQRLTIKAGLWLAFKGCNDQNMLLNIASMEHNPNEAINIDLKKIEYNWSS